MVPPRKGAPANMNAQAGARLRSRPDDLRIACAAAIFAMRAARRAEHKPTSRPAHETDADRDQRDCEISTPSALAVLRLLAQSMADLQRCFVSVRLGNRLRGRVRRSMFSNRSGFYVIGRIAWNG